MDVLFSDSELRSMHRSCGHKSVDTIMRTLEASEFDDLPTES